jgi:hypothetical protein
MIRLKKMKRHLALFAACCLLAVNTGCIGWQLAASAASFNLGWLMGALSTPTTTETQCFRNGVEIDCSEVPQASE